MVEAALAPLHVKGGSPCEYPHINRMQSKVSATNNVTHTATCK
jgi:hypothetical protein